MKCILKAGFAVETDQELGTFFLTDYMVRHFERIIIKVRAFGGIRRCARHGPYKRLLYLAQNNDQPSC